MADLSAKVAKAKSAGYSDAEIAAFLGKDPALAPKIRTARQAGYKDADIVLHLARPEAIGSSASMKGGRIPGETPFLPSAGLMANVNRGLGVGDEIAAGLNTLADVATGKVQNGKTREFLGNVGNAFGRNLATQRGLEDTYTEQRPNSAALARGTGAAVTLAIPSSTAANALAQSPRLMNAARGAVVAGSEGAAYALADRGTASERLAAAGRTARDPITLGLGATAAALGTARRSSKAPASQKAKAVPLDQLRAAKTAAYQAVDNAGVSYKPAAIDAMVDDIAAEVSKANISTTRHPKAASMVGDISALRGKPMTLTELDQLRQVVRRDVASASDPAEKFFGRRIIDRIDNFIEKAGPGAVNAGTASDAPGLLAKARDLNGRVRKVEAVEGAVEKARLRAGSSGSGGNIDNATRQNLRVVLEKTPNLSSEERAALELVVLGGKGQNALRLVGKLSPSGNGLMAAGNLGAAALAGPLGALPGAAGIAAKYLADHQTQKNVAEVLRVISSDKATAAQLASVQRQVAGMPKSAAVSALRRAVAAKLARAAGGQGAMRSSDAVRRSGNALANARP